MNLKQQWLVIIVRGCLSLALIYLIYRETGGWTALFALLVLIYIELSGIQILRLMAMLAGESIHDESRGNDSEHNTTNRPA